MHRTRLLLSPFFLLGLATLLLNDFYLKTEFHNFFTGKLSDFAGLFIFAFFFSCFLPKQSKIIYFLSAVSFVLWKSSFSSVLIDEFNKYSFIPVSRVIDYTDLIALMALIPSYFYFEYLSREWRHEKIHMNIRFVAQILVIGFSVFAFTATSYVEERSLWIEEKYPVSLSDVEIEQILKDDSNISFISSDSHDVESNVNYGLDKSNYAIRLIFELRYPICEKADFTHRLYGIEGLKLPRLKILARIFGVKMNHQENNTMK